MVHIRNVHHDELMPLLDLYRHLHTTDAPLPPEPALLERWEELLRDPKLHCLVAVLDGELVASCTLAIIPNLTRGARPYGIIENVVTHAAHRRKGIGTQVLPAALEIAWDHNCYKVMLLTGRKDKATCRFYEQAGFRRDIKTGFVAMPE